MDAHPLKVLLQLHLGSDSNAALYLPHVLASITAEALQPSSHTQKWTTRVHSLLHAKDASARWAGLCIALRTSIHSRTLMIECAQGWVTVVLPMLSVRTSQSAVIQNALMVYMQKNESAPALKAATRLLRFVFAESTNFPEFQRQVSTPNVPKFSLAISSLAEKNSDEGLQVNHISSLAVTLILTLGLRCSSWKR